MKKLLDYMVKYWPIIVTVTGISGSLLVYAHSHAAGEVQTIERIQKVYSIKADKERELLRTEWEISRIRNEGELSPDRKDDLEYWIEEKKYIQKVLREIKK